MAARDQIKHVIVLMLENRSFDSMLGMLYPAGPGFNGLTGNESNPLGNALPDIPVNSYNPTTIDSYTATIPTPDPGEEFTDMNQQLFGAGGLPPAAQQPPMNGFAFNYFNHKVDPKDGVPNPRDIMHYFTCKQLPVMSTLAKTFAVSDQWHASAPCQTWPNRFFAHTGTCLGQVNNKDFVTSGKVPFPHPSIFQRLTEKGRTWRVYYHDLPFSALVKDVLLQRDNIKGFDQFLADAGATNPSLPNYSFIEPQFYPYLGEFGNPSDQHPPHNVLYGEQLIANVYNTLRKSVCWKNSLLIVTHDEHGGCYDHAPPPCAVSPDDLAPSGFDFNRYGVRVPALIISPWVAPGSIVRSAPNGIVFNPPPYPFDHTSIIATLRDLFHLGGQLTKRDGVAPSLFQFPQYFLQAPTNDGPLFLDCIKPDASMDANRKLAYGPPNDNQNWMAQAYRKLLIEKGLTIGTVLADVETVFENALTAGLHGVASFKSLMGF
jgi:phospholipase C